MTDEQFIKRLQELDKEGGPGIPAMREVLRGQMGRLIELAARGLRRSPKAQTVPEEHKTLIPDGFPDTEAKQKAVSYWTSKGRTDLVARVAEIAEQFHTHHFSRNNKLLIWPSVWQTWYVRAVQIEKAPRDMPKATVVDLFAPVDEAAWLQRLQIYHHGTEDIEAGYWSNRWGPKPGQPGCQIPASALRRFKGKGAA